MSKVFIVSAKRSPIGRMLGGLSAVPAGELLGQVMKSVLADTNMNPANVDEVVVGHVLTAGHGQGVARQAAVFADVPKEVPAYSINMICGSGMKSIMTAYNTIKAGSAEVVLTGGVEMMSQAPFVMNGLQGRNGNKLGDMKLTDTIVGDALTDAFHHYHMGITTENIVERYEITREMQDEFSWKSQQKAISAVDSGRFKDEIVPIEVKTRKGTVIVDTDEHPNRGTSLEKMATLKPAFKKDGTVTAGNASGINDGAAVLLVVSEEAMKKYGLSPMAEIIGIGQGGVDPSVMGLGPVPAIKDVMGKVKLDFTDLELIELNEAFAGQSLGVIHELKEHFEVTDSWMNERTNVNGGAIALGHPLGASGARITTTLLHEMKKKKADYGLASLCIGGGMGTAIIVKSV
ncbi:acetyl-CoA C-acetyltransferase [Cytobacillus spongiae]|uniref:acetyl-CoA C-acetyltransferase n=1 Tax=Cytobacillus spongiae TaxID=2901381 RepID=UPI001F2CCC3B|nr:acetyl-CoA C-acetyltransferase [Cytobacillus spongiae]UII57605.1 acetyl-CoA C-acetyltransferase [Cytobacillus spongiae]